MAKIKLTKVPFNGTASQEAELRKKLAVTKNMSGGLMPSLQQAQEIYGYLPIEVQTIIADELNVSLEEVFGIATFYSQFTLNPQGKYQIAVCIGTACYVKGAGDILDRLAELLKIKSGDCTEDGKFSLLGTRCIGCCGLAPVLTVNADVYGKVGKADMERVLSNYKKD
ncbi:MAG: NAD(P)H-dependent oxidoreductase subunit E [Firmicutes bacterium]|nr:NAD(P)H-dependent oxidoreductase subunit E [Bacillota bacterium]